MKVVVFLQNAWSPFYAGMKWPRKSWLRALWNCPTGRRILILQQAANELHHIEWWIDETTPEVSAEPNGICQPDPEHIQNVLAIQQPDVVIACGKQAAAELPRHWAGPLLILPHPAYRILTNELYREAGRRIAEGITGTIELTQARPKDNPMAKALIP